MKITSCQSCQARENLVDVILVAVGALLLGVAFEMMPPQDAWAGDDAGSVKRNYRLFGEPEGMTDQKEFDIEFRGARCAAGSTTPHRKRLDVARSRAIGAVSCPDTAHA